MPRVQDGQRLFKINMLLVILDKFVSGKIRYLPVFLQHHFEQCSGPCLRVDASGRIELNIRELIILQNRSHLLRCQ